ncbi:MAG: hypothetical protein WC783_00530 [Candidatus Paceibacterota bacterium]|jgi:hypothetical protein
MIRDSDIIEFYNTIKSICRCDVGYRPSASHAGNEFHITVNLEDNTKLNLLSADLFNSPLVEQEFLRSLELIAVTAYANGQRDKLKEIQKVLGVI